MTAKKIYVLCLNFFSWDRCVREEFILPFTEENVELQTKLATEAALTM